jgi:hypothetical protein
MSSASDEVGDGPSQLRQRSLVRFGVLGGVALLGVLMMKPPQMALEGYTDQMRHEYAAWTFLQRGPDVLTDPITEWDASAEHRHVTWPTMPHVYPVGSLLLFVPAGIAANTGLLADDLVHALMVAFFAAAGVLAARRLYLCLRLHHGPLPSLVVSGVGGVQLVWWGLHGFFDTVAALAALVAVHRWQSRKSSGALLLLALALSLHYRLLYLAPLAGYLGWQALRESRGRDWKPWFLAATVLTTGAGLALTVGFADDLERAQGFNPSPFALSRGLDTPAVLALIVGSLLVVSAVHRYERSPATTAVVALAAVTMLWLIQWQGWYPLLLLPTVALMRTTRGLWATFGGWAVSAYLSKTLLLSPVLVVRVLNDSLR